MANKIKVSAAQPAYARGERTRKLREYIAKLGPDEASPLTDILEELNLSHRHGYSIAKVEDALMTLSVKGKPVVCVLNPKTVKRLKHAKKD